MHGLFCVGPSLCSVVWSLCSVGKVVVHCREACCARSGKSLCTVHKMFVKYFLTLKIKQVTWNSELKQHTQPKSWGVSNPLPIVIVAGNSEPPHKKKMFSLFCSHYYSPFFSTNLEVLYMYGKMINCTFRLCNKKCGSSRQILRYLTRSLWVSNWERTVIIGFCHFQHSSSNMINH